MTGLILIYLKNDFDTIDHDLYLKKLYSVCFSKRTVNWFKSYLSNRCFLFNLGNNFSQPASVFCGVPQGSFLERLLLLIYENDTSQAVKCDLFLYANYSCFVCQYKDKIKPILSGSKFKRKIFKNLT